MALQINVTLETGLRLSEGYFKVERASVDNSTGEIFFGGSLYASAQARLEGRPPVMPGYYQNSFAGDKEGNILEQAYDYIKSLAGDAEETYPEKALFCGFCDV